MVIRKFPCNFAAEHQRQETMNYDILSPEKDPMGTAILDYQKTGKAGKLRVLSSMFEEDEMPVKHLFRSYHDMPKLEKKALDLARGKVLDVGAGAGCHSLALQKRMEQEPHANRVGLQQSLSTLTEVARQNYGVGLSSFLYKAP